MTDDKCNHVWISNSGNGGRPVFSGVGMPLMHVKCKRCSCRTWFTEYQWGAIKRSSKSEVGINAKPGDVQAITVHAEDTSGSGLVIKPGEGE